MYYTEAGEGQPIVFAHGWPLSSDAWQPELKFFSENGYRAIAHDRRGHGRSEKTAVGHTIDQYAKDLAALIEHLDLHDVIVMVHSTGGGEVVKYAAQYANGRVAKGHHRRRDPADHGQVGQQPGRAHPERRLRTASVPASFERPSQFWLDQSESFFGAQPRPRRSPTARSSTSGVRPEREPLRRLRLRQGVLRDGPDRGPQGAHGPILIAPHGETTRSSRSTTAARKSIELVADGTLKTYPRAPHGIHVTNRQVLQQDVLCLDQGLTHRSSDGRRGAGTAPRLPSVRTRESQPPVTVTPAPARRSSECQHAAGRDHAFPSTRFGIAFRHGRHRRHVDRRRDRARAHHPPSARYSGGRSGRLGGHHRAVPAGAPAVSERS